MSTSLLPGVDPNRFQLVSSSHSLDHFLKSAEDLNMDPSIDAILVSLVSLLLSFLVVDCHQYQPGAQFTGQPHGQQQQQGYGQPVQGYQQPNQNLLHDSNRIHDREHIKEHLHGVLGEPDLSKMTEEELQFHYFKMHDNDNNNKLDGSELIKSLIHWHGKYFGLELKSTTNICCSRRKQAHGSKCTSNRHNKNFH